MRLLRALLLAWCCVCCVVHPADARLLVVIPSEDFQHSGPESEDRNQSLKVMRNGLLHMLDLFGVEYDLVQPGGQRGNVTTNDCRTGTRTVFGETRTYSAVIHQFKASIFRNPSMRGYSPDSLSLSALGPLLVPNVFMGLNGDFNTATTCSVGFLQAISLTGGGFIAQHRNTGLAYLANDDEVERMDAAKAPGGLRVLLGGATSGLFRYTSEGPVGPAPWADSSSGFVGLDSADVWILPRAQFDAANASQPLVCVALGHFPALTSDWNRYLLTLAYIDSITGGAVFDSDKLPLKIGVQVRGGWRRARQNQSGGFVAADSTVFKASIDSLATLGIPFTVGVNVDSLSFYSDDRNWWERAAPYVRYAPENWGGIADTATSLTARAATWQRPVDPLGRFRTRTAYGDGSAADTSVNGLMRANYFKLDSAFGRGRVDRSLMAADFDWLEKGQRGYKMVNVDSIVSALADAGVRNIVINGRDHRSKPGFGHHNIKSTSNIEGTLPIRYGRGAGESMPLVVTHGYADSGSAVFDVLANSMSNAWTPHLAQVARFWQGIFERRYTSYGGAGTYTATRPDSLDGFSPRIYTIHAGDLGKGTHATGVATRPGWWQIKWITNAVKMINAQAGRTVIEIAPTDEVR